jgi:hypothetical protein
MASDESRPAARRKAVCGAPVPLMSRRNLSCLYFLVSIIALVCVPYEAVYRPIHVLTRTESSVRAMSASMKRNLPFDLRAYCAMAKLKLT